MEPDRRIIHLDMDAFYAAVEALDNPKLAGKPVIVGGLGARGVVSTASYEARKYGIHSAMPMAWARERCPKGIFLKGRIGRYQEVSRRIFAIFRAYTPLVEPLSLDEAFLDVTGSLRLFGPAEYIAREIRAEVKKQVGLTVSAGVAGSKFLAKVASDLDKPDGLTVVPVGGEAAFLEPLPLSRLWGVGKAALSKLRLMGLETIGDLARLDRGLMEQKFGRSGLMMWELAQARDQRPVNPERIRQSLGAEETYERDITDLVVARREILKLSFKVARALRSKRLAGRTVTLKLKSADFKLITRSVTLNEPTCGHQEIWSAAVALLNQEWPWPPLRLMGISLGNFGFKSGLPRQGSLFEAAPLQGAARGADRAKRLKLDQALDAINDKFGEAGILPASLIKKPDC